MPQGANLQTRSFDRLCAVAARHAGIGFAVTNKALASNVATLTTSAPHGLLAADTVTIAGVDATFNGRHTLSAVTATTLSYPKTASDVGSVAVTPNGGVSKRAAFGYQRFTDGDNWEAAIAALAPHTQGWITLAPKGFSRMGQNKAGGFQAAGHLAVYVPKDVTSNLIVAADFFLGLIAQLLDAANYDAAGGEVPPEDLTGVLHKVEALAAGGIAYFDLGDFAKGGISFIDP